MNSLYMLVYELQKNMVENLVDSQKDVILEISKQTTECCYFIRGYASDNSFGKRFSNLWRHFSFEVSVQRMAKNTISNVDKRIEDYCGAFTTLKTAFDDKLRVETRIVVTRTLNEVQNLGQSPFC